ncbi:hypothetical protein H310_12848 [Aphanomyces invadans]|uniref:CWF21 domain-containing protein n=1 Tax=Aphanomyces invadans TaxID=157072 RepID=A0A024THF2_9STRA|nr:hypothetical protein H310_12848 [Aphanomyces invadans]ETV93016.1 hypothetical protein H310_12848 [Aphanomyces invadans]|eukprot:XP_008878281.1 hypothetical protein H310_12848 [Aphanomyces invadans]
MSYNGVGLRTARGSGTNGYVMRNLSYVKPAHIRERERQAQMKYAMLEEPHNKHPVNKQILLHEKKRQVEVKVMELRDELEEQGCDDDEIEEKCAAFREKIRARMETDARRLDDSKHASSHAKAMKKEKELAALKDAFGIRDNYVEGTSFDVDLQEQRRLERAGEPTSTAKQRQAIVAIVQEGRKEECKEGLEEGLEVEGETSSSPALSVILIKLVNIIIEFVFIFQRFVLLERIRVGTQAKNPSNEHQGQNSIEEPRQVSAAVVLRTCRSSTLLTFG